MAELPAGLLAGGAPQALCLARVRHLRVVSRYCGCPWLAAPPVPARERPTQPSARAARRSPLLTRRCVRGASCVHAALAPQVCLNSYRKQASKPPASVGEEWPSRLADSACLCKNPEVAPCQLNCVWAFQGTTVPWVKAQPYRCTRCCTHPRCTTRWGIGLPVPAQTTFIQPQGWPCWSQAGCHRSGLRSGSAGGWAACDGPQL
jgi:hypothetical protein